RRHGRLADLTPLAAAVFREQLVEGSQTTDADQMVQLLAAVLEVFADVVVDLEPCALELAVQQLGEQRDARATARPRLGARLDVADHAQLSFADRLADGLLVEVVARAYRGSVGQRVD